MQQVPVSNIVMSTEIAEEINCEKWLYSAISSRCSFREIVKAECGPSRGVGGNVLVAECMDDITSQLASCHLSKCSKDNENELKLARVRIRWQWQSAQGTDTK